MNHSITKFIFIAASCALISGCAIRKNLDTPFSNPVNKPVLNDGGSDPTRGTKFCSPNVNGEFDEASIKLESGVASDGSAWAEGGGCVLKPIRDVWATLNNLQVMKWVDADRFTYTRTINPGKGFTHLYQITYYKQTVIGPIDWTIDWYHGVDKGDFDHPERVNVVYQRVRGTSNIPVWSGGITLTKVNNEVTSIAVRNVFEARQSTSDNESSARDALKELIGHARNGQPDWKMLNLGFRQNPSAPDAPPGKNAAGSFCLKDKSGHYPSEPMIATGSDNGVSWVKARACLPLPSAEVLKALRRPDLLVWSNATKATILSSSTADDASVLSVGYELHRLFHWTKKWQMTWNYDASDISYKMDPPTADFPVWNGTIMIREVEPQVTALEIDNRLLTDVVSESLEQNQAIALGLIQRLSQ